MSPSRRSPLAHPHALEFLQPTISFAHQCRWRDFATDAADLITRSHCQGIQRNNVNETLDDLFDNVPAEVIMPQSFSSPAHSTARHHTPSTPCPQRAPHSSLPTIPPRPQSSSVAQQSVHAARLDICAPRLLRGIAASLRLQYAPLRLWSSVWRSTPSHAEVLRELSCDLHRARYLPSYACPVPASHSARTAFRVGPQLPALEGHSARMHAHPLTSCARSLLAFGAPKQGAVCPVRCAATAVVPMCVGLRQRRRVLGPVLVSARLLAAARSTSSHSPMRTASSLPLPFAHPPTRSAASISIDTPLVRRMSSPFACTARRLTLRFSCTRDDSIFALALDLYTAHYLARAFHVRATTVAESSPASPSPSTRPTIFASYPAHSPTPVTAPTTAESTSRPACSDAPFAMYYTLPTIPLFYTRDDYDRIHALALLTPDAPSQIRCPPPGSLSPTHGDLICVHDPNAPSPLRCPLIPARPTPLRPHLARLTRLRHIRCPPPS
ncbi:hypothetical protein C8J57DRAFT_1534218 [Mycena rebaudengoi]|nr:hypothetical protein C8J57DRAFT_1534218 [Mycena rebaudengoi]